jgi:hypothetical protein
MRNFDKAVLRIDESLRDWFKPHTDKRTGKRFKGWVNCRTGGPCSSKSKGGKYPVCRPTHAQCKPIKHKMHKKKGHARVQWKESALQENLGYKISDKFTDLPDSPPHGFWVTKNGKFIVVSRMFGHDEALNALYPEIAQGEQIGGSRLQMKALQAGLIRMAKLGNTNTYGLTYHPLHATSAAKKTAKDIASFYNMGVQDDFEGY